MFGIKKVAEALNNIYHALVSIGKIQNEMAKSQKEVAGYLKRIDEAQRVMFKNESGFGLPENPNDEKQLKEFKEEMEIREREFDSLIFAGDSALNRGEDET